MYTTNIEQWRSFDSHTAFFSRYTAIRCIVRTISKSLSSIIYILPWLPISDNEDQGHPLLASVPRRIESILNFHR